MKIKEINYFDSLPLVTSKALEMSKEVLNWSDLKAGQAVRGLIQKIETDYILVKINNFIFGRVYKEHLTDFPMPKIPTSYETNVGHKVKLRIMSVNSRLKRLELSLKDSLVKNRKKMPVGPNDENLLSPGHKFSGIVVSQNDYGYIVQFYDVKGLLKYDEIDTIHTTSSSGDLRKSTFKKG